MQVSEVFKSLKSRNFSLFFTGQMISRIGMWMQRTAVIWMIYSITNSAFMVGVATFAEQFPSFVFSIRGGIIADRYNRYKILMLTQCLSALQAVLLTGFAFAEIYNIPLILGLSVFLGIVNAYDVPVRQSMINEIIDNPQDLTNAVALNSSLNTFARLLGPALAGFLLAKYSASYCFLLNAISFVAVIGGIAAMRFPENAFAPTHSKQKGSLKEAINYLKEHQTLATIIIMTALSNFLVLPYVTLIPVYAKEVFRGDAATYGWLNAAIGVGAFAGAFHQATFKETANLRQLIIVNTVLLGLGLFAFACSHNMAIAMLTLIVIGYTSLCQTTICMTIIQTETDRNFRGRVVSFLAMAIFGMLPLGSLLIGKLAPIIGSMQTLCAQGILSILIAIFFYKKLIQKNKNNGQ